MAVRYLKSRDKWIADVSIHKRRISRTFETKKEAKEFERDVRLRKIGLSGISKPISIKDAFASYLETDSAQKIERSRKADARTLLILEHFLKKERGKLMAEDVLIEDLQLFQLWSASARNEAGLFSKDVWSDTTIAHVSILIKGVFKKLHQTKRIKENPCEFWNVPCGTAEARRPMTREEFDKIMAIAPDWYKPILIFMRLTGARGASVAALTWDDVDFGKATLYLTSMKGGLRSSKKIAIPLYPALEKLMIHQRKSICGQELLLDDSEENYLKNYKVFSEKATANQISLIGHRLIKKAKLKGVVLYGLRHALAVEMTEAGVPLEITRQAMGHSNISQTSYYAKGISTKALNEAFSQIRETETQTEVIDVEEDKSSID